MAHAAQEDCKGLQRGLALDERTSQEGGQQQLKDANHDGNLEPGRADGRLKFAIRSLFTALGVACSSYKTRITRARTSSGKGG